MSSTVDTPARAPDPDVPTILVVDDSKVDQRLAGRLLEKEGGWRVAYAADGQEALESMAAATPQVVLTDLQMPGMDGLALVEQVRLKFPHVPVILMTGQGSEEVAVAALRAGAASYIPKRSRASALIAAVDQVLTATRTASNRTRLLSYLAGTSRRFELENDPALVGPLVAVVKDDLVAAGVCEEHAAMRCGIAVEEALLNSIYHGNLEVSSDLKADGDAAFLQLAAERRRAAPFRDRRVRVTTKMTAAQATIEIADEGPGFDLSKLPDPDDPEALLRPSGRGLTMMRLFMDEVSYANAGNHVTMIKRK